jgi:subfamily B ATP-binding cassette protein MsbA
VKRIFELVAPHAGRMVLAALCSVVVSAMNGAFAWIVKPTVDNIFVAGERGYLALIAAALFGAFFLRGIFGYFQNYLLRSVGAKIVRDLRNDLYKHMVYLPMSHYGTDSTGTMMSRVINDVGMLQNLLALKVKDLFVSTGTIVVLTGVAFYRRWDLTLIALTVLPLAFYAVGRLGKALRNVARRAQRKIATITESLSEGLSGIKIVKSFIMEEREVERFRGKNQDYYREIMRGARLEEATTFVMDFVAGLGVAFLVFYGGILVSEKIITTGDFFSFLAAVLLIYTPAKRLAQVHNGMQQAKAFIERVDEIFTEDRERDGQYEMGQMRSDIVFDRVSFRYEGRREDALDDVSFRVKKGEVVAFVGPSGAGKTTLVDLMARFYSPRSGAIYIDGKDIGSATLKSLRSQIGTVSQHVILFNDTVRANIAFGTPGATDEQIREAAVAAYAHDFIIGLPKGYDTPVGQSGLVLSGGQRQRLSIARAILKKPAILVLDEATSSLDTQSEMMVQKAIDRLMDSSGSPGGGGAPTIFVIAHRLSTIKRADRIVVLQRGRVVEVGSHEDLLARGGIYKRLHDLQFGETVTRGNVPPDIDASAL